MLSETKEEEKCDCVVVTEEMVFGKVDPDWKEAVNQSVLVDGVGIDIRFNTATKENVRLINTIRMRAGYRPMTKAEIAAVCTAGMVNGLDDTTEKCVVFVPTNGLINPYDVVWSCAHLNGRGKWDLGKFSMPIIGSSFKLAFIRIDGRQRIEAGLSPWS